MIKDTEFFQEETKKESIVLHHTVSDGKADSVINWWENDGVRVAVSYIIEKDGSVVQVFPDKYWSWHIGAGSNKNHNKRSIGIEIINIGALTKSGNEYTWGRKPTIYTGKIFEVPKEWRGYKYFASYTGIQLKATAMLCALLCRAHNIPTQVVSTYEYDKTLLDFKGIVSHHNLRQDKSDVSPAFDLIKLQSLLTNE